MLKINIIPSRKVCFEKYDIKYEMRAFLFGQLEGCELKILNKYPNSIFYVKNDIVLFEQDGINKYFWCRYDKVWSVFEGKYRLEHEETRAFIKTAVEEVLKLKDFTPGLNVRRKEMYGGRGIEIKGFYTQL